MDSPQPEISLSALIEELRNRQESVAGSLGESPDSLLAYVEQLEQRIARLEGNAAPPEV